MCERSQPLSWSVKVHISYQSVQWRLIALLNWQKHFTTFNQFIFTQSYPHLTAQDSTWTFTQRRRQEPKFCPKLVATPKRAKPCQMEALYCHLRRQRLAKWLLSSFVDVCWLLRQLLPTQSDALSQRLCPVFGSSLWHASFSVNVKWRKKWKMQSKNKIESKK